MDDRLAAGGQDRQDPDATGDTQADRVQRFPQAGRDPWSAPREKALGATSGDRPSGGHPGSPAPEHPHPRTWVPEPEAERVSLLFAQVAEALASSTTALLDDDPGLGQVVVAGDRAIDQTTNEVESAIWHRLKQDQPDFPELRRAIGVLLILPELERSADLAEHIAQRALTGIGARMTPASRGIVQQMSEVALSMWAQAATAYAEGTVDYDDVDEADDQLDVLHERLTNEVASGVMDAALAAQVTLLSRFYERLGDHAVHLARRLQTLPG
jgi:phosphate transport system protein